MISLLEENTTPEPVIIVRQRNQIPEKGVQRRSRSVFGLKKSIESAGHKIIEFGVISFKRMITAILLRILAGKPFHRVDLGFTVRRSSTVSEGTSL